MCGIVWTYLEKTFHSFTSDESPGNTLANGATHANGTEMVKIEMSDEPTGRVVLDGRVYQENKFRVRQVPSE